MFVITMLVISYALIILMIGMIIFVLTDEDTRDKGGSIFLIIGMLGTLSYVTHVPALCIAFKNIDVAYAAPTVLVKTNNMVFVDYVADGYVRCQEVSKETEYWNATNIMIKITNGENIYGVSVRPTYRIVVR